MLKKLRKQRNLQLLIFGGMSALFVLWGVGGTLGTQQRAMMAGTVYGHQIPVRTFMEQQQAVERALRWAMGDAPLAAEQLELQTWIRLALLEAARRQQLQVGDDDVVNTIQRLPFLQREGQFDAERYQRFLQLQHMLPRQFEEEIRQTLLLDQLRRRVMSDAPQDEASLRRAYDQEHQRFRVRYVPVEFKRFGGEAMALASAIAMKQDLAHAQERRQTVEALLHRKHLRLVALAPLNAQDQLDDKSVSAATLIDAAQKLSPGQWSEPVAATGQWLLVQLVDVVKPDEAQWQTDRDTYLTQHRTEAEQATWQSFVEEALQRAKLKSYLRGKDEGGRQ